MKTFPESEYVDVGSFDAYEQVRDDLGYMNNKVVIVSSGGGPAYPPWVPPILRWRP